MLSGGMKKALPTVTIGVEPYISSLEQIDDLHDAGADEDQIEYRDLFRSYSRKSAQRRITV